MNVLLGDLIPEVSRLLKESIAFGLDNRQEAVAYALGFGRGLDLAQADEFIATIQGLLEAGDNTKAASTAKKLGAILEP